MTIKLIAGLGNIGIQYFNTRHNLGSRYVELLSKNYAVVLRKDFVLCGYTATIQLNNNVVRLFIPNAYMNNSGVSIYKCMEHDKLCPEEILVAHDDLDLLPGVIRIKIGINNMMIHDSHRGVKDIVVKIGNQSHFNRLRIGIGRPNDKKKITDFVLDKLINYEKEVIDRVIYEAIKYTEEIVTSNFVKVMNKLHSFKCD